MRKQLRHVAQSRLCLLSAHRTPEEADLMHFGTLKLILMEQVPRVCVWSLPLPVLCISVYVRPVHVLLMRLGPHELLLEQVQRLRCACLRARARARACACLCASARACSCARVRVRVLCACADAVCA